MTFGSIILFIALGAAVFSLWSYLRASLLELRLQKKSDGHRRRARIAFLLLTGALSAASALLLSHFLYYRFEFEYVAHYSSLDLPFGYLISAFWAGQEGTFLLWALLTALFGIIFYKTSRQLENVGMIVVISVEIFFLLILLKKSPFTILPEVPRDGNGLNPLLQNPWMVIHPPILFIGYAATAFPFAIAIAGLIRKDYGTWIRFALPWTLATSIMLGAGIVIGGFWAYETLGWGGYWGWDPVENSSLIPWLTILALLHGLLIQRMTGALQRLNFFLALVTFVLVVYATFLTRSGVLADFSVHSFQDLGINSYLIVCVALSAGLSAFVYAIRFRSIPSARIEYKRLNRQNALYVGMLILCASAILTFAGTSLPIVSGWFGNTSQVDSSFYNRVYLPIGIAIELMLGVTPWLIWRGEDWRQVVKKLLIPFVLSTIVLIAILITGVYDIVLMIFIWSGAFALFTNIMFAVRQWKLGWLLMGAPLSHVGVAMMLIGIIVSGNFGKTERIVLQKNSSTKLAGYTVEYLSSGKDNRGRDEIVLQCTSEDGKAFELRPLLFYNATTNSIMREPDIKIFPLRDIYISALEKQGGEYDFSSGEMNDNSVPQNAGNDGLPDAILELHKDELKEYKGSTLKFVGFITEHRQENDYIRVTAGIEVSDSTGKEIIRPAIEIRNGVRIGVPGTVWRKRPPLDLILHDIDADIRTIQVAIQRHPDEQAIIELSIKPLMSLLWAGTIIMLVGIGIAVKRRLTENKISQ